MTLLQSDVVLDYRDYQARASYDLTPRDRLTLFGFGAYAFVWGTISTTVRQRLVPIPLQGRIASVNMVGVFGGLVIGQFLGGLIATKWGVAAPFWFAFVGAGVTLALVWRQLDHIAHTEA